MYINVCFCSGRNAAAGRYDDDSSAALKSDLKRLLENEQYSLQKTFVCICV